MTRILLVLTWLVSFHFSSAQYSSLAFKKSELKKIASCAKSPTLFVVITNEKNSGDAALVNAAKKFWKKGPVKFISRIEFINQIGQSKLQAGQFYLYEWVYEGKNKALKYIDLNTLLPAPNSGYFALSLIDPSLSTSNKAGSAVDRLSLFFNMGLVASDQKGRVLDPYYDLMLKYFNNEIDFATATLQPELKKKKKNGYYYFGNAFVEIPSKDVLLVKEQTEKKQPGQAKKKKKKGEPASVVDQFKLNKKNIYTVFPEDVSLSLQKSDPKVALYCNGMLLSAENGSVLAAAVPVKRHPLLFSIIGTGVATAIATLSYVLAHQEK
jgi:hypothetical protein